MYVCIYICNPGHRVSRPRGTGSVGDSVGEGTLTDSCASPSGGAGKGGGGAEAGNQTGGSSTAHGCPGVCKRCVSKRIYM